MVVGVMGAATEVAEMEEAMVVGVTAEVKAVGARVVVMAVGEKVVEKVAAVTEVVRVAAARVAVAEVDWAMVKMAPEEGEAAGCPGNTSGRRSDPLWVRRSIDRRAYPPRPSHLELSSMRRCIGECRIERDKAAPNSSLGGANGASPRPGLGHTRRQVDR